MNQQKLIQFLRDSGLVSLQKATEIANAFSSKIFAKNDFFLKAGRFSDEYLFLENGCMRAFAVDTDGNEVTTNFYAGNEVVFEVYSFFTRTVSKENIQALTECEGWYITYDQLNNLFHELHEFRDFGRYILVKGFSALKNRMLSMITETAEERYLKLLQHNPEIFKYAALKHIASYLGITDTSLSRIRKELSHR